MHLAVSETTTYTRLVNVIFIFARSALYVGGRKTESVRFPFVLPSVRPENNHFLSKGYLGVDTSKFFCVFDPLILYALKGFEKPPS